MDFDEVEELYKILFTEQGKQTTEENHNIGKYKTILHNIDCEEDYNDCDLYEVLREAKEIQRVKNQIKYFEKLLNMVQGCGWCSTNESDIQAIKERLKHVSESINVKEFCSVLKEMKIKVRDVYWLFYVVTDRKPIVVNCPEEFIMNDFYSFLSEYRLKADGRTNFISHELVLYNILRKNGVCCRPGDFASLKTDHAPIFQKVFEKLGWKFFPLIIKRKWKITYTSL